MLLGLSFFFFEQACQKNYSVHVFLQKVQVQVYTSIDG